MTADSAATDSAPAHTETDQPVAVIAGGGSGIGRGCAMRLAGLGYAVTLVGRTPAKMERTADEIRTAGGTADTFAADVTDWDRIAELGEAMRTGGVDLLVNSAGGQFSQPTAELTSKGWHEVIDKNLTGSFHLLRHLYPALCARRGSAVMIVANMWQLPAPSIAHSAASRAGIVNLTRTLAVEWAPDGIRLNSVAPGLTDTEALPDKFRQWVDKVPLKRIGTIDEVVDAVVFLGRSQYITGEVISVDGGLRLG